MVRRGSVMGPAGASGKCCRRVGKCAGALGERASAPAARAPRCSRVGEVRRSRLWRVRDMRRGKWRCSRCVLRRVGLVCWESVSRKAAPPCGITGTAAYSVSPFVLSVLLVRRVRVAGACSCRWCVFVLLRAATADTFRAPAALGTRAEAWCVGKVPWVPPARWGSAAGA